MIKHATVQPAVLGFAAMRKECTITPHHKDFCYIVSQTAAVTDILNLILVNFYYRSFIFSMYNTSHKSYAYRYTFKRFVRKRLK